MWSIGIGLEVRPVTFAVSNSLYQHLAFGWRPARVPQMYERASRVSRLNPKPQILDPDPKAHTPNPKLQPLTGHVYTEAGLESVCAEA